MKTAMKAAMSKDLNILVMFKFTTHTHTHTRTHNHHTISLQTSSNCTVIYYKYILLSLPPLTPNSS